jgi:hypothetical protein
MWIVTRMNFKQLKVTRENLDWHNGLSLKLLLLLRQLLRLRPPVLLCWTR